MRYALYGGVITGATIGLPVLNLLNCLCCGGVILGGVLSVFFATRDVSDEGPVMTSADALQLGALSGVVGAVAGTTLSILVQLLVGDLARSAVLSMIEDGQLEGLFPPGSTEALLEMVGPDGEFSFFAIAGQFLVWIFAAPLFGLIGGLIGFSLFGRKGVGPGVTTQ
jgi:hypothetical protein